MMQELKSTMIEREGQNITHCRSYFYKRQAAFFEVDTPNIKRHIVKNINIDRQYASSTEGQPLNLALYFVTFVFILSLHVFVPNLEGCALHSEGR